jgi:hypothetical protein
MSKSANKDTRLIFRVSPHDKTAIKSKARRAKVTVSDFCRKAALGKEVKYIEGLPGLVYELNKIGNNLNQLTIAANQGHDVTAAAVAIKIRLNRILDEIGKAIGGDGDSDSQTG